MREPSPQLDLIPVADAGAVLAAAADALVARARDRLPDLAHALVLLPNLHAGGEYRQRLLQSSGCPSLILPRVSTYARLAADNAEFAQHANLATGQTAQIHLGQIDLVQAALDPTVLQRKSQCLEVLLAIEKAQM